MASAASFAAVSYGTDTCGSLRLPAAFNGLFALRPTQGLISTRGIIPLSHSQDVAGPLARTVIDLAIGLDAIAGSDPTAAAMTAYQGRSPPRFVQSLASGTLRGLRLGMIRAHTDTAPEEFEGARVIRAAVEQMRSHGAEIVYVSLPLPDSVIGRASVTDFEFKFDLIDYLSREPARTRPLASRDSGKGALRGCTRTPIPVSRLCRHPHRGRLQSSSGTASDGRQCVERGTKDATLGCAPLPNFPSGPRANRRTEFRH